MIFGVIVAKVATTQLLERMDRQIHQAVQIKSEVMNRLKAAESQKAVAERNRSTLDKKKNKINNKISRLRKEMESIEQEQEQRRQRTEARKVD